MKNLLDAVEINPKSKPTACVIWLHGLGADGYDFASIVPQLDLPEDHAIRFVFPHAPHRTVTMNAGLMMPAWFDIKSLGLHMEMDLPGMQESYQQVNDLIEREVESGIPHDKIILAGFSQGGAVVLYTLLTHPHKFGGVLALSTFLPAKEKLPVPIETTNQNTPIFLAHGQLDPLVPFTLGQHTNDLLQKLNYPIQWHEYPIEHTVSMEEIRDISGWIWKTLS